MAMAREAGERCSDHVEDDFDPDGPMDDGNPMGMPRTSSRSSSTWPTSSSTSAQSIAAHASQVTDSGFFLQMPTRRSPYAFGREWFIEHGREPGLRPGWLFDDA